MAAYICPHCKKPVYDDEALLCLYCGESLGRGSTFMERLKYPKHKIFLAAVIILVLLSFAVFILLTQM